MHSAEEILILGMEGETHPSVRSSAIFAGDNFAGLVENYKDGIRATAAKLG